MQTRDFIQEQFRSELTTVRLLYIQKQYQDRSNCYNYLGHYTISLFKLQRNLSETEKLQ